MKKIIILLCAIAVAQVQADFRPIVQFGKDLVIKKKLTKTIEVNGAYTIEAGVEYFDTNGSDYSTQFLVGYKSDSLERIRRKNKNVPIKVTRKTFSLLQKYSQDKYHLGLGLTYHIKPHADYTFKRATTREFNNALGVLAQTGYSITENIDLNLRMTLIKYKIEVKRKKKIYKRSYNTSSLGVFFTYKF